MKSYSIGGILEYKPEEIWKDIPRYNGLYQASTYGRIKSIAHFYYSTYKGKKVRRWLEEKIFEMKKLNSKGYKRLNLNGVVHFAHKLIAITFIPNLDNKPQINHIDGNKLNNTVKNLEWVTNQENRTHAIKMGLHANRKTGLGKITFEQIRTIKNLYGIGVSQKRIAKQYNIVQQTVSKLIKE